MRVSKGRALWREHEGRALGFDMLGLRPKPCQRDTSLWNPIWLETKVPAGRRVLVCVYSFRMAANGESFMARSAGYKPAASATMMEKPTAPKARYAGMMLLSPELTSS